MKAYGETTPADPAPPQRVPSEQLRIAVTFKGRGNSSPARMQARLSAASVGDFAPVAGEVERAIEALKQKGFVVSGRGEMSLSVRGTREQFEQTFGTELSVMKMPLTMGYSESAVLYPAQGAPWQPDPALSELIDDAYIQWPHIYMGTARAANAETAGSTKSTRATISVGRSTRATPSSGRATFAAGGPVTKKAPTRKVPKTKVGLLSAEPPKRTAPYLDVLVDVPRLLNASPIHEQSARGSGIRIAMIDTGFAHSHPFFVANGFTSSVMLAPGATHRETDPGSHGTGESANIFAIAPQVSFIGIKLENDDDSNGGASILEGFQEALRHDPHVISVSMGYDLRDPDGRSPLAQLPNGLKALEMEIQAAVAKGIVVVFSAGNGHYSFPGQMPEVISAGGVYLDEQGRLVASDYASAFVSRIYSGRTVPDICGLVGPLPHADYIMLPIPPRSSLDLSCAAFDGTKPDDGWAVFSGTSAAAPQIAAICALLRQKNSALAPAAIKALLERTALDVRRGHANPASDPAGKGLPATPARDGATGAGLVDAFAAWNQA